MRYFIFPRLPCTTDIDFPAALLFRRLSLSVFLCFPALFTRPIYAFNFSSVQLIEYTTTYLATILCFFHQWMGITRSGLPGLPVIRLVVLVS